VLGGKEENCRDPAGSRYDNCRATNDNSRGSEGILINGTQDRKRRFLLRALCAPISEVLFLSFTVPLRGGGASRRDSEYHHSRFLNSPRLRLFSGNEHESWPLRERRLMRASFIAICRRSFVCFSFLLAFFLSCLASGYVMTSNFASNTPGRDRARPLLAIFTFRRVLQQGARILKMYKR